MAQLSTPINHHYRLPHGLTVNGGLQVVAQVEVLPLWLRDYVTRACITIRGVVLVQMSE